MHNLKWRSILPRFKWWQIGYVTFCFDWSFERYSKNQYTEGIIKDGGILQAEQNNQRLKYADNRFELIATVTDVRDDFVIISGLLLSKYDFMSYENRNYKVEMILLI